ncbi:YciI family protein [Acidocella sp.]|uniref:YciI family protein n=1 Tax=Acidocella sp. TaxID=50710 RepID=UPI003CFDB961
MPLYVLHAKDRPGALQLRMDHYAAHRAFLEGQDEAGLVSVVMSGPLQTDDGEMMTGSLLLLEAQDREAVDQFVAEDPFTREGVWGEVNVSRFYRRRTPGRASSGGR